MATSFIKIFPFIQVIQLTQDTHSYMYVRMDTQPKT